MQRTFHSQEFKEQALSKVRQRGLRTLDEVASDLNMSLGTLKAFHYTQLIPSLESRMKRTPAAKSMTRCNPSQMVLTPGSPSPLRARKPPSMATRRTTSLSEGGAEGEGLFVNTYAALISSGANISEAGKSGQGACPEFCVRGIA